ncbi:hypothetical protein [Tateyamaria sp. SN3-11]|uniref:hypothetical protein n=1 Tax=Tateyamaria sp. SN3-11 TaxID=3092147 RepID=UPI0039EB4BC5
MKQKDVTSMTLTGIHAGLTLDFAARSGVLASGATVKALTGYEITSEQPATGKPYDVITIANDEDETDPPSLVVSVYYTQDEAYEEIDMGVRFEDIPKGTELEVASDEAKLNIGRKAISGSSLVAATGSNLGEFSTAIHMRLWFERPDEIESGSKLSLTMSRVDGDGGGPVKKIIMEQIALVLP